MAPPSSGSDIPSGFGLIERARGFTSISRFLAGTVGGLGLAAVLVPIEALRAFALGIWVFISELFIQGTAFITSVLIGGSEIIGAGASGSAAAVAAQGIASFLVGIAIAFVGVGLAIFIADLFGFDIPFLGDILPFGLGAEDDDDGE